MVRKDILVAKEYVKKFIEKDKPELVFLTGSRALGCHRKSSDIDICVIGKYSKKDLRQPILDFTHITKYPEKYKGYDFEVEYESYNNLNNCLDQVFQFKLWKFQNAILIGGDKANLRKLDLKLNKVDSMKGRVWLLYHSKDLIKKAKYGLDMKLAILRSSELLLKLVFLINEKPIPMDKWMLNEYGKLKWKPTGLLQNINKSIDEQDSKYIMDSRKIIGKYIKLKNLIPKEDFEYIEKNE